MLGSPQPADHQADEASEDSDNDEDMALAAGSTVVKSESPNGQEKFLPVLHNHFVCWMQSLQQRRARMM